MADISYIPDQNQGNTVPAWLAMNNGGWGGGLFGGNGGSAFWGALLGSVIPGFFGGWNGNGFGGGNGGAAAASLGAQATAIGNTDLILNAINGTDADVRLLASTLNTDVDSLKVGLSTIQGAIANIGSQVGMSSLQVVNAIQAGNSSLASQLCECCCNMKQLVTEQGYQNQIATLNQTNALGGAISAASQRNADGIADLKATVIDQFCGLEKRELQNKINTQAEIITQLRNEADNARQTATIGAMIAPLAQEVNDIKCKLPSTATVNYPNLVAVNNTPYMGGFGAGYGFGYGVPGGSYWG